VFPDPDGKVHRPRSAELLRVDLKAAGLAAEINGVKLNFHDTRACVATWLTNMQVPDALVRRLLGHAPRGTLEHSYLMRDDILEALLEAVKKIPVVWAAEPSRP
jgi:integrase